MAVIEIDGIKWKIIYADKIEKAEEFLYIRRFSTEIEREGALIYTKTGCLCHKFSQVDRWVFPNLVLPNGQVFRKSGIPDKHWPIVDKTIPCEEFDRLMSFALDHHIFEMPSQEMKLAYVDAHDTIGVRTKGNVEHWYTVSGTRHERDEHQEIMAELLSGEEGIRFGELTLS